MNGTRRPGFIGPNPAAERVRSHYLGQIHVEPIVAEFLIAEGNRALAAAAAAELVVGMIQGANVVAKGKNDISLFAAFGHVAVQLLRSSAH